MGQVLTKIHNTDGSTYILYCYLENDINELLSTPNSGLNSFQKAANGDLFILGTDLIYRMRKRNWIAILAQ